MKLRIRGDSIRLRLTRNEVDQAHATGVVHDTVHFSADSALVYRLCADAQCTTLQAKFAGKQITVLAPADDIRHWALSDTVSLHGQQDLGSNRQLTILIEKDFACLAPREGEDESDMFEHPAARDGGTC